MDEGNSVAENGVKGGVSYVEKNNVGTVTTKQFIKLEHRKKFQASKKCILFPDFQIHLEISLVCAILDQMIDGGTPPDLVLDLTYGGVTSEVIKSLSLTLGLPTVTSTMGEAGDI